MAGIMVQYHRVTSLTGVVICVFTVWLHRCVTFYATTRRYLIDRRVSPENIYRFSFIVLLRRHRPYLQSRIAATIRKSSPGRSSNPRPASRWSLVSKQRSPSKPSEGLRHLYVLARFRFAFCHLLHFIETTALP